MTFLLPFVLCSILTHPLIGHEDEIDLPEGFSLEYFSDEDIGESPGPNVSKALHPSSISSLKYPDGNQALTTFEGSPSTIVAGCVNAVSGSYFDSQVDLVVASAQPILVQRTYCSSEKEWSFRHMPLLKVQNGGTSHLYASYQDDSGSGMNYRARNYTDLTSKLKLPSRLFEEHGLTNCGAGEVSGQTNWRNSSLNFVRTSNEKCYLLRHGSHVDRVFKRHKRYGTHHQKGAPHGKFHLSQEIHPNGNQLVYKHNDNDRLRKILSLNPSGKTLCELEITHTKYATIWKSDHNQIAYIFDAKKRLVQTQPTHSIPALYSYDEKGRIQSKRLPCGRFLDIHYYPSGKHEGKVHFLAAPLGAKGMPVKTHLFNYGPGITEVYDAKGNLTKYIYGKKSKRLKAIHHFDKRDLIFKELFSWAPNTSCHVGNLIKRTFEGSGGICFSRTLKYDVLDNVVEETLVGNLTGQSSEDTFVKTFRTSQDSWHLPLEENDGKKQILSNYYTKSNLLKSRFTTSQGQILKREFFKYDGNGEIAEEIWDDGLEKDPDDLKGITERHFKVTTARAQEPIGLPECIEEYYFDKTIGNYQLLKKIINTYSAQGKVLHQEHYGSNGQYAYTLHWEYDHLGNITKEVNALGEATLYRYDRNGNKIEEQGPDLSSHKEFVYDLANRLIQEKEVWASGESLNTSHRYNALNQRIATTDIHGHETTYTYDAFGHPIHGSYPAIYDGNNSLISVEERRQYDSLGNVTTHWDANGHPTKSLYTLRGKPYLIQYADGSSERKQYTIDGLLEKEIAKNGLVTTYTHDALGHVIQTELHDLQGNLLKITSAAYYGSKLISETDASGSTTYFEYDGAGRKTATIRDGYVTKYIYDVLGRIVRTIESLNGQDISITVKEYDLLDRVIEERIEDSSGKIFQKEEYRYHANGKRTHVIAHTQAGQATTVTTYTPHGEIASITDALGNVTSFSYNYKYLHKGQCVLAVTKTDPLKNQEIKIHDTHGRVSVLTHRNAEKSITKSENYVYDSMGNLLQTEVTVFTPQAAPRTVVTTYQYDAMGYLIHTIEAKGTPEQKHTHICYNLYGQKESVLTPNGIKLLHSYDALGRLIEFQASDNSFHYSYQYDVLDHPIYIEDLVYNKATVRSYDRYDNLISETLNNGYTVLCSYDALKRPITLSLPNNHSVNYNHSALYLEEIAWARNQNTLTTGYKYDLAGNIVQQTLIGNAGTINYQHDLLNRPSVTEAPHWNETITRHGYDAVGNILERHVIDSQGSTTYCYAYDDLYQLISESGDRSLTYQHDSICNRITKNKNLYQVNALNQLIEQTDCHYQYDANGCLLEQKQGQQTIRYRYDALDRLIEVQTPQSTITYVYDSFNRRLSKTENGKKTDYLYQGQNEIGAIIDGKMTELRILGNGRGAEVGAAIALELNGEVLVPIHDSFGNITALLDTEGRLVENYRYTSFGETQVFNSGKQINNAWRYSSKRFDPETAFFYFGQRYYAPEIGRWITPDPAGFADGPNLYAYVHNQPLRYIDPDGRFAMILIPMAIGMAVEYCLPTASVYLAEYAGGTAVAAALTGLVRGYNGSVFEPSVFEGVNPTAGIIEKGTMIVGVVLSLNPGSLVKKGGTAAFNALSNLATKELTSAGTNALAVKVSKSVTSWFTSGCTHCATITQTAQKSLQGVEGSVIRSTSKLDLDALSKAGQVMDRAGLTKAGRALDKHGNRLNSPFPKAKGSPFIKNNQGQFHLDDILTDPKGSFITEFKNGDFKIYSRDGRGAYFRNDGSFRGFIEKRYE